MKEHGYRRITAMLTDRIRNGIYAPGSALPPRLDLMAEFGVARATIDRCIGELRQQGLVLSRHGSGTYVQKRLSRPCRIAVIGVLTTEELQLPPEWTPEFFRAEELMRKSDWPRLLNHDGLLWVRPEEPLYELMAWTRAQLPQVVVNRVIPGEYCVSTDHRGAYRQIAAERLAALPESPVFLLLGKKSPPCEYRAAGVVDACREARRFYEMLTMPEAFDAKTALLREQLPPPGGVPLLLISVSIANTGAVMRYVQEQHLTWRKDLFYSDFDDAHPADVWGVTVTSFLQDYPALIDKAGVLLQQLIEGKAPEQRLHLLSPRRRNGDT